MMMPTLIEIIPIANEGRISRLSDNPFNVSEIDQEDIEESSCFFDNEYFPNLEKLKHCCARQDGNKDCTVEFMDPDFCSRRYTVMLTSASETCLIMISKLFNIIDSFERESSLFVEIIDESCEPRVEACLFYIGGSRKLYVCPPFFADRLRSFER
jgi:hypothetical protein